MKQQVLKIARYLYHILDYRMYAALLEKFVLLRKFRTSAPQLFIIGLPRSGTTLIYQYIVHRLKVAYLTNGVGKAPLFPCITTFFQHRLHGDYLSDFRSNYGKTRGPNSPREAGGVWARFFGYEEYVRYVDVNAKDIKMLRSTVACIQAIFGNAVFVNKNVKHMLRIDALSKIFPNSYFLIVERNLKDVALSVLKGRYENMADPLQWWSVRPLNYLSLKNLPITEQVVYQIISLQKKMEKDLSEVYSKRVFRIDYEEFCKNPEILIKKLNNVIGPVQVRNFAKKSFKPNEYKPHTLNEKQIVELLENVLSE